MPDTDQKLYAHLHTAWWWRECYNRLADRADKKAIKGLMTHLWKMAAAQWVSVDYYTFHD